MEPTTEADYTQNDARLARLLSRIEDRTAKVVVVGQGYVGLPVAMQAASRGFPTIGYEVDAKRCQALQDGESYVEDVPSSVLQAALASNYQATSQVNDLVDFDVAVITVPTPLRDGAPDLSYVTSAGESLATILKPGALVVLESTTFPGTTEELLLPVLEQSGLEVGTDFYLGYSPERIDPGNKIWGFENTPKVVAGLEPRSRLATASFYDNLIETIVEVENVATAELVKILENTYRHVNIALVNEISMFARELGVDMWSAIDAASTKPFGFKAFWPGPGVGGHCLPIDPSYLSWRIRQNLGHTLRFVELANDVNEHMPDYVAQRIGSLLNDHRLAVKGTKALLLGMTYKAGASDWRESPSLAVAKRLTTLGADLRLCDPHLAEGVDLGLDAPFVEFSPAELASVDLVVVLVDHPEFNPAVIAENARLVFDAKALLRGQAFAGELL